MSTTPIYTLDFGEIGLKDVALVGGKNASLGQLFNALKPLGVGALDGFAATSDAYHRLLIERNLEFQLRSLLSDFDPEDVDELAARGHAARAAALETPLPDDLRSAILTAYDRLCVRLGREPELAVRSSATAEDLPEASFAGQQETFLNVRGREALLRATHACFASLFTDRAISYRARHGFDHLQVALSVGVQPMVRSDKASAGVIFTLDTESGFRDVVVVTGSYGLGEFVVQGVVTPDEWTVFKPTLANVKVMIPFCRTVDEGRRVIEAMAANGLKQGEDGLEVYAMCELPSNVILADEFLKVFDGYSIGSNDLTQLALGLDRDSGTVAHLFDERNAAVRQMIAREIEAAHFAGKPIGICGQAPSDYPDFAAWLVKEGIDSISLNPDTAIKTALVIAEEEAAQVQAAAT